MSSIWIDVVEGDLIAGPPLYAGFEVGLSAVADTYQCDVDLFAWCEVGCGLISLRDSGGEGGECSERCGCFGEIAACYLWGWLVHGSIFCDLP